MCCLFWVFFFSCHTHFDFKRTFSAPEQFKLCPLFNQKVSDGQENQPCALHFWAQTHWFLLLVSDYPQKKKNHILHSSLLIAWPLACGVQKKRGKSMHIEEELSTKLFYYVYLCKWHIRLFKKVSVAPPLSALWSAFPPCSMDGWMSGSGRRRVRNWFYANLYKRRM